MSDFGGTFFITVVGVMLIVLFIYFIFIFNSIIRLKNNIRKSWANIDVLLKQRSDEVPNLIASVRGYMIHERTTLEALTKARTEVLQTLSPSKKAVVHDVISESLKSIFSVAEQYPNLKANTNFLKLQTRITGIENELADRREFYNDSVNMYNIRIQSFPDLIVARLLKYEPEELFKAKEDEKKVVTVHL